MHIQEIIEVDIMSKLIIELIVLIIFIIAITICIWDAIPTIIKIIVIPFIIIGFLKSLLYK